MPNDGQGQGGTQGQGGQAGAGGAASGASGQAGAGGEGQGGAGGQQGQGQEQVTWEQWLEGQPQEIRELYEGHTQGLRSALTSERQAHQNLAKQLRGAAGELPRGGEAGH